MRLSAAAGGLRVASALLATCALASPALAQHVTREVDTAALPREHAIAGGDHLELGEICDRAAESATARDWGDGWIVHCELEATSDPALVLVRLHYPGEEQAWLARRERRALRVIALVDGCMRGPDGNAGCGVEFRAFHRRVFGADRVIAVETQAEEYDFDLGELPGGIRVIRRHLTVCVATDDVTGLSCTASIPLETSSREFLLVDATGPSSWPYRERPTESRTARAIAILRSDGTVRVRLREGTWRALYQDTPAWREAPAEDAGPDRSVRWRAER